MGTWDARALVVVGLNRLAVESELIAVDVVWRILEGQVPHGAQDFRLLNCESEKRWHFLIITHNTSITIIGTPSNPTFCFCRIYKKKLLLRFSLKS